MNTTLPTSRERWGQIQSKYTLCLIKIKSFQIYLDFTAQTLQLWMFVPCNDKGEPMEIPELKDYVFEDHPELVGNPKEYNKDEYNSDCEEFYKARDRVIFKGWEKDNNGIHTENEYIYWDDQGIDHVYSKTSLHSNCVIKTIEALNNTKIPLELTEAKAKELGLNN